MSEDLESSLILNSFEIPTIGFHSFSELIQNIYKLPQTTEFTVVFFINRTAVYKNCTVVFTNSSAVFTIHSVVLRNLHTMQTFMMQNKKVCSEAEQNNPCLQKLSVPNRGCICKKGNRQPLNKLQIL